MTSHPYGRRRHGRLGSRIGWPAVVATLAVGAVVGAAVAPSAAPPPDEPPVVQPDQVAAFMRAKLGHAAHVLEGLSMENYALIEKGAHDLALASQASSWQVLQTADYARHSEDFRRSCNLLRDAGKARNLDGAALAWMEVTMKCINCHKYVRDVDRTP